jgi:hypothetical protein
MAPSGNLFVNAIYWICDTAKLEKPSHGRPRDNPGSEAQRLRGSEAQRLRGSEAQRLRGSEAQRLREVRESVRFGFL